MLGMRELCGIKFPLSNLCLPKRAILWSFSLFIQVFGSNGMLETRNNSKINVVSHKGTNGCTSEPIPHSFTQRYADAYAAEMDYFISHELGSYCFD